ncbi:MAG: NTP transferase domain-containing protein [Dehalococcoidia bacterium]
MILAAGRGSRLRATATDDPKPLTPLLGSPLIEHAIARFRGAGVSEIIVVVGYGREKMLPKLAEIRQREHVSITPAVCRDWRLGNGSSALAAAPHVEEPFFLAMADHLFDPEALTRLVAEDDGQRACAVVIDRAPDPSIDVEEATKVQLAGDLVQRIGKELPRYHAIDTGLFLCRDGLFDALRDAAADGQHGLSDAVGRLALAGEAAAVDGTGLGWMDIDTPAELAAAEELLLTWPGSSSDGEPSHPDGPNDAPLSPAGAEAP